LGILDVEQHLNNIICAGPENFGTNCRANQSDTFDGLPPELFVLLRAEFIEITDEELQSVLEVGSKFCFYFLGCRR
jgi:hypothetical protein